MSETPDADTPTNGGRALMKPPKGGTGVAQPISTRDLVLELRGEVKTLASLFRDFVNRKPWFYRIVWTLAENKEGQLKYVALIILGIAAIMNGMVFSGYGFSIAEAVTSSSKGVTP